MAGDLRISVPPVHLPVMERIAAQYRQETGESVTLVPTPRPSLASDSFRCDDSTQTNPAGTSQAGPLCSNSADIFIAAQDWRTDDVRPGGTVIFAIAQIALWSPNPALIDPKGDVLRNRNFDWIASASPESDPFGKAAFSVMIKAGVLDRINHRLLYLPDSRQVYASIVSGQTRLGFVALPQVWRYGQLVEGSLWIPPLNWYPVIAMTASLNPDPTREDSSGASANRFLRFLLQEPVRQTLLTYGYLTPVGLVSS